MQCAFIRGVLCGPLKLRMSSVVCAKLISKGLADLQARWKVCGPKAPGVTCAYVAGVLLACQVVSPCCICLYRQHTHACVCPQAVGGSQGEL